MSKRFVRKPVERLQSPALQVCCWALLGCALACDDRKDIEPDALPLSDEDDPGNAAVSLVTEQFDRAELAASDSLDAPDTTGGAWRIIEVPGFPVVHSPVGWLTIWARSLGDGKNPTGYQSALYAGACPAT